MALQFQSKRPARNWLARREQYKLLFLVFTVGFVFLVAAQAADPANWYWLVGNPDREGRDEEEDTRRVVAIEAKDISAEPTEDFDAVFPGAERIQMSETNTVRLSPRSSEWKPFFALLQLVATKDQKEIESLPKRNVSYRQLVSQPAIYRRELVRVLGTVVKVEKVASRPDHADLYGVESYYEIWIRPVGSAANWVIVNSLEQPLNMADGKPIGSRDEVMVSALFFKVWMPLRTEAQLNQRTKRPLLFAKNMNVVDLKAVSAAITQTPSTGKKQQSDPRMDGLPARYASFVDYMKEEWPRLQPSRLDVFSDGIPVTDATVDSVPGQVRTIIDLLWRLPGVPADLMRGWQREDVTLADLAASPGDHRGGVISLHGRVKRIEVLRDTPEKYRLDEDPFDAYFRCEMEVEGQSERAVIYAREIPFAWKVGAQVNYQASAKAFFLKVGPKVAGASMECIFVAGRIGWQSNDIFEALQFDAGLLDHVVDYADLPGRNTSIFSKTKVLSASGSKRPKSRRVEWVCFNRMLAAVQSVPPENLQKLVPSQAPNTRLLGEMFIDPASHHGELVTLNGIVRRVERVRVEKKARKVFGVKDYYHVDMFVQLDGGGIEQHGQVFRNLPLSIAVTDLPAGFPIGSGLRENVSVTALFFKVVAVRTEQDQSKQNWHLMLIASDLERLSSGDKSSDFSEMNAWAGGLFVVAVLAILIGIWIYRRGDKKFQEQVIEQGRTIKSDSGAMDTLQAEEAKPPDFSHLE